MSVFSIGIGITRETSKKVCKNKSHADAVSYTAHSFYDVRCL